MSECKQNICMSEQEHWHREPYLVWCHQSDGTTYWRCECCGWIKYDDKWVSVRDRLPNFMQAVLIYQKWTGEEDVTLYQRTVLCHYDGKIFTSLDGICYHATKYWQPLPKPPVDTVEKS